MEFTDSLPPPAKQPSSQPFKRFGLFPLEIRLQIWEQSFVPRRIIIKAPPKHPNLPFHSTGALLLVNHEARRVFLSHYIAWFSSASRTGLYFNAKIDTLALMNSFPVFQGLCASSPDFMEGIRWLDFEPDIDFPSGADYDLLCTSLSKMSSLRLITIRWSSGRLDERLSIDGEEEEEEEEEEVEEETETERNLTVDTCGIIWNNLDILRNALQEAEIEGELPGKRQKPKLAAIISPDEIDHIEFRKYYGTDIEKTQFRLLVHEISEEALERAEVDAEREWRGIWPGRERLGEMGWFAMEINLDKRVLSPF